MSLPAVSCPCCNVALPLEAWIAHQGAREAFLALAGLHPSVRLPMAGIRYAGLFAPAKQTMRWERIADVLAELRELVGTGRVEWEGRGHPAPLDYWLQAIDTIAAKPDLRRPLNGHNLLRKIVAGYSEQAQASAERERLTSGRGETPVGAGFKPPPTVEAGLNPAPTPRASMPAHIRDTLRNFALNDQMKNPPQQPQEPNDGQP